MTPQPARVAIATVVLIAARDRCVFMRPLNTCESADIVPDILDSACNAHDIEHDPSTSDEPFSDCRISWDSGCAFRYRLPAPCCG